jgi:hypothetical protein
MCNPLAIVAVAGAAVGAAADAAGLRVAQRRAELE